MRTPYRHDLAERTQFVLLNSCGCPLEVMEGSQAANEDDARWELAKGDGRTLLMWHRRGLRVVHVSHDDYERDYYPLMMSSCPHGERGGAT